MEAVWIAAYFASTVEGTVERLTSGDSTGVRCRVPCSGVVQSELHPNGGELRWWCPVCRDNGVISN